MSALPSQPERLVERIASLDEQIERLQGTIVDSQSRGKPSADLEQSLLLLREVRRTYELRLQQLENDARNG